MQIEQVEIQRILKYTKEDWQSLLELIPLIEQAMSENSEFGELVHGDKLPNGNIIAPHYNHLQLVHDFHILCYKLKLDLSFDWGEWEQGKELINNSLEQEKFNELDIIELCKLITAMIRCERFCDGALVSFFENGTILKTLKAIQHHIET